MSQDKPDSPWPLPPERVECFIKNAHRMVRHRYTGVPLWSFISEMTGHGSGYSIQICRQLNLDPFQDAHKPLQHNITQGGAECVWKYDEHHYAWDSACGEKWTFTNDGPLENNVKFCHGCGLKVSVQKPKPAAE